MKRALLFLRFGLVFSTFVFLQALAAPSTFNLKGRWSAEIEFEQFKFRMVLNVTPSEDGTRVQISMDNPDQGMSGMPVSALLYNHPEVRVEIDQFGTRFMGRLQPDGNTIVGQFDEVPGNKSPVVRFTRDVTPPKPPVARSFVIPPGEPADPRGYWGTTIDAMPGLSLRLGLRIARLEKGKFEAFLDSFNQGMRDLPASSAVWKDGGATLEWRGLQLKFDAKLEEEGRVLAGSWVQAGNRKEVQFRRLAGPATVFPEGISLVPGPDPAKDPRGEWKGELKERGNVLGLVIRLGRLEDGSHAASLVSVDQGNVELAATKTTFEHPGLVVEWKAIGGTFRGKLTPEGDQLNGIWEQGGPPTPLIFRRGTAGEGRK